MWMRKEEVRKFSFGVIFAQVFISFPRIRVVADIVFGLGGADAVKLFYRLMFSGDRSSI